MGVISDSILQATSYYRKVIQASEMDNDWKKDVAVLESYMAQMKKVLECCKAGNSVESCLYLAPDLNARRLGKVATDIIDACVPICQQLQRANSAKATRAKEEKKLMKCINKF